MSKLAHSNDDTMYEIEMNNLGMVRYVPAPKQCEHLTGVNRDCRRCTRGAKWKNKANGRLYCNQHAVMVAISRGNHETTD